MSRDVCNLCGGIIAPDITGRPMCYGCGPVREMGVSSRKPLPDCPCRSARYEAPRSDVTRHAPDHCCDGFCVVCSKRREPQP